MNKSEIVNKWVAGYKEYEKKGKINFFASFTFFVTATMLLVIALSKSPEVSFMTELSNSWFKLIMSILLIVGFFSFMLYEVLKMVIVETYKDKINKSSDGDIMFNILDFYKIYFREKNKDISEEDLNSMVQNQIKKEKFKALSKEVYVGVDKAKIEKSEKVLDKIENQYNTGLIDFKLSELVYSILRFR